jgi:hypothetical protein
VVLGELWRLVSGSLLSLGCNAFYSHWLRTPMGIMDVPKALYVLLWGLVLPTGARDGLLSFEGQEARKLVYVYDFVDTRRQKPA